MPSEWNVAKGFYRLVLPTGVVMAGSNTLEVEARHEALDKLLARYRTPEIFNTDQGAQYATEPFRHL
jgi:hypothetical protein